jgi:hypothetical protein
MQGACPAFKAQLSGRRAAFGMDRPEEARLDVTLKCSFPPAVTTCYTVRLRANTPNPGGAQSAWEARCTRLRLSAEPQPEADP